MIVYYIRWHYPTSSDISHYCASKDDDKLFHYKENAEKYAKEQLKKWQCDEKRFYKLDNKDDKEGLSPKEQEKWRKLALIVCGDLPDDYIICERDIKFEDEL